MCGGWLGLLKVCVRVNGQSPSNPEVGPWQAPGRTGARAANPGRSVDFVGR